MSLKQALDGSGAERSTDDPDETWLASFLSDRLRKYEITGEEYDAYTLTIMVEAIHVPKDVKEEPHIDGRPVTMSMSEHSAGLEVELARIFDRKAPFILHMKVIYGPPMNFRHGEADMKMLGNGMKPLLRLLKSRGGSDKIEVCFGYKYEEPKEDEKTKEDLFHKMARVLVLRAWVGKMMERRMY